MIHFSYVPIGRHPLSLADPARRDPAGAGPRQRAPAARGIGPRARRPRPHPAHDPPRGRWSGHPARLARGWAAPAGPGGMAPPPGVRGAGGRRPRRSAGAVECARPPRHRALGARPALAVGDVDRPCPGAGPGAAQPRRGAAGAGPSGRGRPPRRRRPARQGGPATLMTPQQIARFFTVMARALDAPATVVLTGAAAGTLMGAGRPSLDVDFAVVLPWGRPAVPWSRVEQAVQAATRQTGIAAQFAEDISRWSLISFLEYRRHTRPYRRFGRLDVRSEEHT